MQQRNNVLNIDHKLLDLVLASASTKVVVVHSDFAFVREDNYHPALDIPVETAGSDKKHNFPFANISSFNFYKLNCDDLNDAIASVDLTVPTKKSSSKKLLYPVWFTHDAISNIKMKDYCRRLLSKNEIYYAEFKRLRTITKAQISTTHGNYLRQSQNCIKSDVSLLWNYINLKHGRTRIPGSVYFNDALLDDPQTIVDSFAELFSSTLVLYSTKFCY